MPSDYDQGDNKLNPTTAIMDEELLQQAKNFNEQCEKAADSLAQADVLLFVTGAGFGADSGLPVYGDIAKVPAYQKRGLEYADISQPKWVDSDPELFYGFWGQCFNDYRSTKPHEGYDIVARWRNDKKNNKASDDVRACVQTKVEAQRPFDSEGTQRFTPYDVTGGPAGAFFTFTSNVDGHFYDKFEAYEINDCHGSIELWQCSNRDCPSGIWRAPLEHEFLVDSRTMLAPADKEAFEKDKTSLGILEQRLSSSEDNTEPSVGVPHIGHTTGSGQRTGLLRNMPESKDKEGWYQDDSANFPRCGHCHSLARPAIFMFGDFGWKYDSSQSIRWDLWRETVVELGQDLNVCVVEVGCGPSVGTCRATSEQMVFDLLKKDGNAKLVRINPDFPLSSDQVVGENMIPIMSRGLRAIKRIDEIYLQKYGAVDKAD